MVETYIHVQLAAKFKKLPSWPYGSNAKSNYVVTQHGRWDKIFPIITFLFVSFSLSSFYFSSPWESKGAVIYCRFAAKK